MRIEAVEPPHYLCWTWSTTPEVPLAEAGQTLRTERVLMGRPDGGTDIHLLESGLAGPKDFESNVNGWDGDVPPALRRYLGDQ